MRKLGLLLALGAGGLSSGCAAMAVGAAATGSVMAVQDRTIGQGLDDAAASQRAKTRLMAFDPQAYRDVDVEVAQGRLLLSGAVPSEELRRDAERIAWNVNGVDQVVNELRVGAGGGLSRTTMDQWITTQIRTRYMADAAIKGVNINIETQDGVVYLMGLARSAPEAQRAADTAAHVRGVKKVVSYIEVRGPRAPIEHAAHSHASPSYAAAPAPAYAPAPSYTPAPAAALSSGVPAEPAPYVWGAQGEPMSLAPAPY
jgi:osmotically-inducible protein OsmY